MKNQILFQGEFHKTINFFKRLFDISVNFQYCSTADSRPLVTYPLPLLVILLQ